MAIQQLPNGVKVAFQAGEKAQYDLKLQKDEGTLYFVNDSDKLYLYLGENPLYALIDVLDNLDSSSTLPVQSKAIFNYLKTNNLVERKTGSYQPEDKQDYVAPRIYLYEEDGTVVFYHQMGAEPKILLTKDDLSEKYVSTEKDKAATGTAIAEGLKTIVEIVDYLTESGSEGIDKKLWGLVKHSEEEGPDTTDFYYFPTTESKAVKLGEGSAEGSGFYQIVVGDKTLEAETLKGKVNFLGETGIKISADDNDGNITISLDETSGFVLLDPSGESQTIKKKLIVEGDLTVNTDSSLLTDTIKPNGENPVTIEGSETVSQDLLVNGKITASQDVQISGNLTVTVKGTLEDLVVNKTITNTNIFETKQQTDEGESPQFKLLEGVNLLLGDTYFIKPDSAIFPSTNIKGQLTGGEEGSIHELIGTSFTFDKGSFYISNSNLVSELNSISNQSPLIIGAKNTTTEHLEVSKNQIQTYLTDTEANILNLNPHGGQVKIGTGGLEVGTNGISVKGPLTVEGTTELKQNLTVSGDSTLTGSLTVNGDIETTWFKGKSTEPTEGLQMQQKLIFGSKSITAEGDATFGTLTASGSAIFNSTLQVDEDITFKNKILTQESETSLAETDSRDAVSEIEMRLIFDNQYLLSKADILSDDGLIRKELMSLNSTISKNKTILDELIVIAANEEGQPPTKVTTNTLIWIDIAEDMGSGVIHIKSGEDWVPVTSTWY